MRVRQGIKSWAIWALFLGMAFGLGAPTAPASIRKEDPEDLEYADTAKDCPFLTGTYQVEGLYCVQSWKKGQPMAFFQLNATGYYGNWLIFSANDIQFLMSGPKHNIAARAFIKQFRKSCVSPRKVGGLTEIGGNLVVENVVVNAKAVQDGLEHRLSWNSPESAPQLKIPGLPQVIRARDAGVGLLKQARFFKLEDTGHLYIQTDWVVVDPTKKQVFKRHENMCLLRLDRLPDEEATQAKSLLSR